MEQHWFLIDAEHTVYAGFLYLLGCLLTLRWIFTYSFCRLVFCHRFLSACAYTVRFLPPLMPILYMINTAHNAIPFLYTLPAVPFLTVACTCWFSAIPFSFLTVSQVPFEPFSFRFCRSFCLPLGLYRSATCRFRSCSPPFYRSCRSAGFLPVPACLPAWVVLCLQVSACRFSAVFVSCLDSACVSRFFVPGTFYRFTVLYRSVFCLPFLWISACLRRVLCYRHPRRSAHRHCGTVSAACHSWIAAPACRSACRYIVTVLHVCTTAFVCTFAGLPAVFCAAVSAISAIPFVLRLDSCTVFVRTLQIFSFLTTVSVSAAAPYRSAGFCTVRFWFSGCGFLDLPAWAPASYILFCSYTVSSTACRLPLPPLDFCVSAVCFYLPACVFCADWFRSAVLLPFSATAWNRSAAWRLPFTTCCGARSPLPAWILPAVSHAAVTLGLPLPFSRSGCVLFGSFCVWSCVICCCCVMGLRLDGWNTAFLRLPPAVTCRLPAFTLYCRLPFSIAGFRFLLHRFWMPFVLTLLPPPAWLVLCQTGYRYRFLGCIYRRYTAALRISRFWMRLLTLEQDCRFVSYIEQHASGTLLIYFCFQIIYTTDFPEQTDSAFFFTFCVFVFHVFDGVLVSFLTCSILLPAVSLYRYWVCTCRLWVLPGFWFR